MSNFLLVTSETKASFTRYGMPEQNCTIFIHPGFFPSLDRLQITKSVQCNFATIRVSPFLNNSTKSRSFLQDESRFLGLFWEEKKLYLVTQETDQNQTAFDEGLHQFSSANNLYTCTASLC